MNTVTLKDYQPQPFFRWFEEISRIPRGSGKEEAVGQFIMDFAAKRGLFAQRDEIGNVFLRVPASPGYEAEPVLLLQAHLDMVWAKVPGAEFDFETQPIRFRVEGDMLYGDGTNLGSDNGIGIAFMLAVADDPDMAHPPLELLFTVQEEIGLIGIQHFDMTKLTARRMINTDCGYSHGMCVSSVGCAKYTISKGYAPTGWEGLQPLRLRIAGGLGGHGGLMIHRGRACAVNAAGQLLHLLKNEMPVRLISLEASGAAIHAQSDTVFAVPADLADRAQALLSAYWHRYSDRYQMSDPAVTVGTERVETAEPALSAAESGRLIDLLYLIPTAALRHDGEDTNFVLTSNSIADTQLRDGQFSMTASVRAAINSERDSVCEQLATISRLLDFELRPAGSYDSWPSRPASVLQEKLRSAHRRLFDSEIEVEHIHGGIEVSYIMTHHPDMDAVGISPTAQGAHTTEEHLFISEVQPFWDLMTEFLRTKDQT